MFVTHARMTACITNFISFIRVLIIYNYKREYREKLKQKSTKAVCDPTIDKIFLSIMDFYIPACELDYSSL